MTATAVHALLSRCEIIIGEETGASTEPITPNETVLEFLLESGKAARVRIVETHEKYQREEAFFFSAVLVEQPFTRFAGCYNPRTGRGILNQVEV